MSHYWNFEEARKWLLMAFSHRENLAPIKASILRDTLKRLSYFDENRNFNFEKALNDSNFRSDYEYGDDKYLRNFIDDLKTYRESCDRVTGVEFSELATGYASPWGNPHHYLT